MDFQTRLGQTTDLTSVVNYIIDILINLIFHLFGIIAVVVVGVAGNTITEAPCVSSRSSE